MITGDKAPRRRGLLAAGLIGALTAGPLLGASPGRGAARSPAAPNAVRVRVVRAQARIPAQARLIAIPRAFLGLSTEYATLRLVERRAALYERVLSQLKVPGDGRFVLRIGGDTAEHAIFDPTTARLPPWAFPVTTALVANTVNIIRALRLRVIVDLNTISATAVRSAAWMRAVVRQADAEGAPPQSLLALEIGNEPDIYNRDLWWHNLKAAEPPSVIKKAGLSFPRLPSRITPTSYVRTYDRFARALAKGVPATPLVAPALAVVDRHLSWLTTLLRRRREGLRVVSIHIYPYSACARPGDRAYPTVRKLLSENASAGMAKTAAPAIALAHRAGLSLRLTEINSVTCGGVKRVSDTFATALWAPDALFELMRARAEGVNLHARVQSVNDPFYFTRRGLATHPLLYGLILFARMLGPRARLVPVHVHSSGSGHLKVWAVRQGDGITTPNTLKVLMINKGRESATVHLQLPATREATVSRLLAASASSTSKVTLAGQSLDRDANWRGRLRLQVVRPRSHWYVVRVRGESAALLAVPVAPTTLAAPPQVSAGGGPLLGYE